MTKQELKDLKAAANVYKEGLEKTKEREEKKIPKDFDIIFDTERKINNLSKLGRIMELVIYSEDTNNIDLNEVLSLIHKYFPDFKYQKDLILDENEYNELKSIILATITSQRRHNNELFERKCITLDIWDVNDNNIQSVSTKIMQNLDDAYMNGKCFSYRTKESITKEINITVTSF